MKLQAALDRFLVQLEADGRSPHTIGQYRRHVGVFAAWLAHGGRRRAVAAIRHEDIAAFLAAPVARVAAHGGPKQPVVKRRLPLRDKATPCLTIGVAVWSEGRRQEGGPGPGMPGPGRENELVAAGAAQ
jgi:hypothetical protein